jgi:hypothetical protein
MRVLRSTVLCSLVSCCITAAAGCGGGTDQQPEMPNPASVDRSADDLGLPEADAEAASTDETSGDEEDEAPASPVRVVAGESEPIEGTTPTLRIQSPRNGQRIASGDVMLRLQLRHWELSPDPGSHVHVIVDNEPYIAVRDVSQPLNLSQLVHDNLGHDLAPGTHVVRAFPSRGHHESVKTPGAFAMVVFTLGQPTEGFSFDPNAPLLTYSRPKGCYPAGQRVLLDFYLTNTEISESGNHVHYVLDHGGLEGDITEWTPHWIENLPAMEHTIELSLVDAQGQPIAGPFNDTTRTIRVAESCQ